MNPDYHDITSRIAESPSWWQEGGVPRYGDFSPKESSSIYAREVALMEIACQSCDTSFRVAMCADVQDMRLADRIVTGKLHYGDPPNTGCCAAGATMNSIPVRILEYWSTHDQRYTKDGTVVDVDKYFEWNRDPLLEGPYDGWMGQERPPGATT